MLVIECRMLGSEVVVRCVELPCATQPFTLVLNERVMRLFEFLGRGSIATICSTVECRCARDSYYVKIVTKFVRDTSVRDVCDSP